MKISSIIVVLAAGFALTFCAGEIYERRKKLASAESSNSSIPACEGVKPFLLAVKQSDGSWIGQQPQGRDGHLLFHGSNTVKKVVHVDDFCIFEMSASGVYNGASYNGVIFGAGVPNKRR